MVKGETLLAPNSEIHTGIKFLHSKDNFSTKIHTELAVVNAKEAMSKDKYAQWCNIFKTGQSDTGHAQSRGSLKSAVTEKYFACIISIILEFFQQY